MGQLLRALEEKSDFLEIFVKDLGEEGIHVHIGSEMQELHNVSLVVKDCYVGNIPIGTVAVLGPTRMHYPKVVSVVEFVSKSVNDVMTRMTRGRFRHLPVTVDGRLVGIVSIGDVVKARIHAVEREAEDMRAYISAA